MDVISVLGSTVTSSPPLIAALLLGVVTSISPCPLGSNIAAIAFLSRNAKSTGNPLATPLFYSLGRGITYLLLAAIAGFAGAAALRVFTSLQSYSDLLLSAILAIAGLIMLGKLTISLDFIPFEKFESVASKGALGALALGAGMAFVLCPMSAALFIGGVLPLVISNKDWILIPLGYGLGTSLPILILPLGAVVKTPNKLMEFGKLAYHINCFGRRVSTGKRILFVGMGVAPIICNDFVRWWYL